MQTEYDDDTDDVLQDGESVRVSMHMMDSMQKAVAKSKVQLTDARGLPAGNRPGFAFSDTDNDAKRKLQAAYDAAEHDLTHAWKQDEDLGEGDQCIVGGQEGRVVRSGGQLVCQPLKQATETDRKVVQRDPMGRAKSTFEEPDEDEWNIAEPLSDGQDLKDAAYNEYEDELRNAWRK